MSTTLKLPVRAIFAACTLFFTISAHAQVTVDEPWVRATVPQQQATGAFMRLSAQTDSALVQAESPAAEHVEIHEMTMDKDIMTMRQIPRLALPAGQTVALKPGGFHIMLINLKEQAREGEHIPLTLTFEHADGEREVVNIKAPVRALTSTASNGQHHHQQATVKDTTSAAAPHGISVTQCWIRALPNNLPSAAYFKLQNHSTDRIVLTGAQSKAFGKVMLHANKTMNGMATMVHADNIEIPAGASLEFAPGGYHVMLEEPASELQIGKSVPIKLLFGDNPPMTTSCEIKSPASLSLNTLGIG
tara:strand:- start:7893 stop:8801 length:909 start_codon:yes stop_codon:yes gene_type:complete